MWGTARKSFQVPCRQHLMRTQAVLHVGTSGDQGMASGKIRRGLHMEKPSRLVLPSWEKPWADYMKKTARAAALHSGQEIRHTGRRSRPVGQLIVCGASWLQDWEK
jgi:hypothetical protein